jgi:four helix bundle protein
MFRFEELDVWQKAVEHAGRVYEITRGFPDDERYGLTSQMRRSAVSVSSNIAEGSGRTSDTDFARFLEIAYGSLMENVSQSRIAKLQ